MSEKIFCGNARKINTQYGEIMKVSFSRGDIQKMIDWMDVENSNWVNLDILEKRNPAENKPTHYAVINEYKKPAEQPTEKKREEPQPTLQDPVYEQPAPEDDGADDLPF
jgi:hypothetical protein